MVQLTRPYNAAATILFTVSSFQIQNSLVFVLLFITNNAIDSV